MRRVFSICILVLAALVFTQFSAASTASAQDVWAYSSENGQTYVMTETIINSPEEVSVKVKSWRMMRYSAQSVVPNVVQASLLIQGGIVVSRM